MRTLSLNRIARPIHVFSIFIYGLILATCAGPASKKDNNNENIDKEKSNRPSFKPYWGANFFEVRRSFDNGLAFDTIGFEQEPIWHINFIHDDSVMVFSPDSNAMLHYSIYHDQDSIFYFGREWFRVKSLAKDSMMLQRLAVKSKRVKEERSNVYMKLYSESFIKDSLHTTVEELRKPRRVDTLFIRERAARSNRNSSNIDSAFSARRPVELTPLYATISVKPRTFSDDERLTQSAAYHYLYPEFDIVIDRAYKDFYYEFSVLVDGNGKIRLGKFVAMDEFKESRAKVLTGIIDVYLQNMLQIRPGTTLDIPLTSLIMLRVRGKKQ